MLLMDVSFPFFTQTSAAAHTQTNVLRRLPTGLIPLICSNLLCVDIVCLALSCHASLFKMTRALLLYPKFRESGERNQPILEREQMSRMPLKYISRGKQNFESPEERKNEEKAMLNPRKLKGDFNYIC